MSVLIKGMEMPKRGELLCINIYPDGKVCINLDLECNRIATAVPVPSHGRLIDADEFLKDFEMIILETLYDHEEVEEMIKDAPTVIDAEEGE